MMQSRQGAMNGMAELCFAPRAAVRRLAKADPVLGALMKAAGPFTLQLRTMHSPFEALARNIIYQQLHGTAAAAIHARVVALGANGRKLRPEDILSADEVTLRGAGLSRAKLAALQDLA